MGLRDFRSWAHADLELEPGRTVFVGSNGFGKTNLVEALWFSATLGSHRVGTDTPLIRAGADRAVVSTIVVNEGRECAIDLEIAAGRANKARLNRSAVRSTREVIGVLRAVLFAPEDLALVRGDPAERRRYLDDLATVRRPAVAGVRADYEKVLRQRTALLKSAAGMRHRADRGALDTLDVWDSRLGDRARRRCCSYCRRSWRRAPEKCRTGCATGSCAIWRCWAKLSGAFCFALTGAMCTRTPRRGCGWRCRPAPMSASG